MNYKFEYLVGNFKNEDMLILQNSFVPNMKKNSIKGRTTLDSVINIKLSPKHTDLEIDVELVSDSECNLLDRAIHGGLGKALGKGRVEKRQMVL